jgi:hypothetical protein
MKLKKVLNGTIAEISAATISYPLNTIKTNVQILNPVPKNLFTGFKFCIANELINGLVFYTIFEALKDKTENTFLKATCGSVGAMALSHPFYLRRKLAQTSQSLKITNNYKGFGICVVNSVPGAAFNFHLKETISKRTSLGIFSGFLSTTITTLITHPLDTFALCILTRSPFKFNFNGLRQRLIEKNLTLGTKLMILDYLNKLN